MNRRSPILEKLAELYSASTAGETGSAGRDYSIRYVKLLAAAHCEAGDAYDLAVKDLKDADGSALMLMTHRRSGDPQRVTVPLACEAALFASIGRPSPTEERQAWAALMNDAAGWEVPSEHAAAWQTFCRDRAALMLRGGGWQPFRRKQRERARVQLSVAARLLGWRRPALLRTVSAQLLGSSKFLESCRSTLEALLNLGSAGRVRSFPDLGISDNPRKVVFCGPVSVTLAGEITNYAPHAGASSISDADLARAERIECAAPCCVTVENETTFHELSRLAVGDLFVLTSYPNRATIDFLGRLPAGLPRHHFGDTDPWGFDVLRSLRAALASIEIAPLNMSYRPSPTAGALTDRDRRKLARLLDDPLLADVRPELERMQTAGMKGDFEQEQISVSGDFPYCRSPAES